MIKKLLITYLFLITNVFAGLPPTTMRGQSQTLKPTTFNFQVPNKQATITAASTSLIETGNNNELENRGFEHTTVTTGWTISNATPSSSTTRIEGSKSLSLALTGALSLSQSSTINAAQKSGVQMVASIWVNSSDVSDLQLCSLKNGSEDKCTVTGGYVQGSGWRQLTVSFLGDSTSNGLKLKSTDTTGTVLVDQAYVGIGSPVVDFTPDMVYSAQVSSSGVVSGENTDWINGNCSVSGSRISCNYISGLVTVPMNCVATPMTAGIANDTILGYSTGNTSSGFAFDGGAGARQFSVVCQKQGADYKTSKAYVASSSDTDWTPCTFSTLAWQGLGTVTNNLYCSRKGSSLKIRGKFTTGTVSANLAQIPLPSNYGSISTTSSISSNSSAGSFYRETSANATYFNAIISPSSSVIQLSAAVIWNSVNPSVAVNGSGVVGSTETASIVNEISIPIQGWTDSGVIVGSFEGIEKCANALECTSEFTAYISTTGVVTNENIDWINGNCTLPTGTQRSCTYNTNLKDGVNPLSSPMNCTASAKTGTGYTSSAFVLAPTSTGFIFNSGYATAGELQDIIVHCQKGTSDYKPKTAKIASSIGVPTVPGVTTQAIDTFSVSYGTTNATTACTALTTCSYLDQIGSGAVASIVQGTAGNFTMNLGKTYSKLKCAGNAFLPTSSAVMLPIQCSNCSAPTFATLNSTNAVSAATYGTLYCQGIPQ